MFGGRDVPSIARRCGTIGEIADYLVRLPAAAVRSAHGAEVVQRVDDTTKSCGLINADSTAKRARVSKKRRTRSTPQLFLDSFQRH